MFDYKRQLWILKKFSFMHVYNDNLFSEDISASINSESIYVSGRRNSVYKFTNR